MAQSKPTLNPETDTPKQKSEITKPFMLAYMKSSKVTEEDIKWFKALVSNPANQKEYTNHITDKPYTDIDIPKVRQAFIERFYPSLVNKGSKKRTFIDTIMNL